MPGSANGWGSQASCETRNDVCLSACCVASCGLPSQVGPPAPLLSSNMLRQVASRLGSGFVRSIATTAARFEGEAAPAGVKEFTEAWAKTAPSTLALPELPTNFLPPETSAEAAVDGERFSINFYTPHGVVAQTKVRWICPDHLSPQLGASGCTQSMQGVR